MNPEDRSDSQPKHLKHPVWNFLSSALMELPVTLIPHLGHPSTTGAAAGGAGAASATGARLGAALAGAAAVLAGAAAAEMAAIEALRSATTASFFLSRIVSLSMYPGFPSPQESQVTSSSSSNKQPQTSQVHLSQKMVSSSVKGVSQFMQQHFCQNCIALFGRIYSGSASLPMGFSGRPHRLQAHLLHTRSCPHNTNSPGLGTTSH